MSAPLALSCDALGGVSRLIAGMRSMFLVETGEFRHLRDGRWVQIQPERTEFPANPGRSSTQAAVSFDLSQVYVRLGLGARAETLPDFTGSEGVPAALRGRP